MGPNLNKKLTEDAENFITGVNDLSFLTNKQCNTFIKFYFSFYKILQTISYYFYKLFFTKNINTTINHVIYLYFLQRLCFIEFKNYFNKNYKKVHFL